MNDQLDGVATPEDSETLKRHLAESPEARAKFRELGEVFASLNRVEMVDPPSDLRQNVLRSIRLREAPAQARPGWLATLLGAFQTRPALQYAYPFVAGAGVAIVAFALLTGNARMGPAKAENPFAGTMLPTSDLSDFRRADGREYRLPDGRVSVETLTSEHGLIAKVEAQGTVGTKIEIAYDPASLTAVALRQRHSGGNDLSIALGVFQIELNDRTENQYLLYLARTKPGGSPLRVNVTSGAETYQGELRLGTLQPGD
ncbi:MAG: hypothetical protein HY568_03225 [Candidatus Latescibacteria bacterium]|nr:hypothetical protein [Candidatus Latescibacterota bacterium]